MKGKALDASFTTKCYPGCGRKDWRNCGLPLNQGHEPSSSIRPLAGTLKVIQTVEKYVLKSIANKLLITPAGLRRR